MLLHPDHVDHPWLLVHGVANSAAVWRFWQQRLAVLGWRSHAIDLRGHGLGRPADLSVTSMRDYAHDVACVGRQLCVRLVPSWTEAVGLEERTDSRHNPRVCQDALSPSSTRAILLARRTSTRPWASNSTTDCLPTANPIGGPAPWRGGPRRCHCRFA